MRVLKHLMKIDASPAARDARHWRAEALHLQMSAIAAFSPSMRRLMNVERLWRSRRKLALAAGAREPLQDCPFTLDDLLGEDFDLDTALAKLATKRPASA